MISNNRPIYINKIGITSGDIEMNDKHLFYLQSVIPWHEITSLTIHDPLKSCHLRLLVSKMINLRTLELKFCYDDKDINLKMENLINFLNDTSLCNMLMSNGLQKLYFYTYWKIPNLIWFVSLIVKQLPQLQIIEFSCANDDDIQLPEALHIFINGLSNLNFLIYHGRLRGGNEQHSKMFDLQQNSVRPYRIEYYTPAESCEEPVLYLWLQ